MSHEALIRLACRDAPTAERVAAALAPELADGPGGTTLEASTHDEMLHIAATAEQIGQLRAALQGIVRLADAAIRVAEGRP